MNNVIIQKHGVSSDVGNYTGDIAELVVNDTTKHISVHDNVTQGGIVQANLLDVQSAQSVLDSKVSTDTLTTLSLVGDVLRYTSEDGAVYDLSLSKYLDDTNLAKISSGSIDSSGILTITRSDSSTFTIDLSSLLDSTKLTSSEVLALGFLRTDMSNVTTLSSSTVTTLKGPSGIAGVAGPKGYTGSRGNTGYTGSKGTNGDIGSVGNTGYTGSIGNTGYTGSRGNTGYTGSRGNTGYTGSIGNNGANGPTGYRGSIGYSGATGNGGVVGTAGATGATGPIGATGNTGATGNAGANKRSVAVPTTIGGLPATNFTQKAILSATTDGSANVGYSIACNKGIIVVGAPYDDAGMSSSQSGKVHVYDKNGVETKTIYDYGGYPNDYFGVGVAVNNPAVSSDTKIAIGAKQGDDSNGSKAYCIVYIFSVTGSLIAKVSGPTNTQYQDYGYELAITDTELYVGDRLDTHPTLGGSGKGVVYVYSLTGILLRTLYKNNSNSYEYMGCSVAVDTNGYTLAGAYGANTNAGVVYRFAADGSFSNTISASDSVANDNFGYCIAMSNSSLLVGAPGVDGGKGAIYAFTLNGTQLYKYQPADAVAGDRFGTSISASNTRTIVGAIRGNGNKGAAYVLDDRLNFLNKITDSSGSVDDRLGYAVGANNTNVIVGIPKKNNGIGKSILYNSFKNSVMELTSIIDLDY